MIIKRDLQKLIAAKHNGLVKVVTGLRRCGKSFLLFNLFREHLLQSGVTPNHIIAIDLEKAVDASLLNPVTLLEHIQARIINDGKWSYVLIDEIQNCQTVLLDGVDVSRIHPNDIDKAYVSFHKTLAALRSMPNVDVYVTGSNSKMLASDIATEFRGRSETIALAPLDFAEFMSLRTDARDLYSVFYEYLDFGGLPECVLRATEEQKTAYLSNLYTTIYLRDIAERYGLKNDLLLETLTRILMSNIGGLVNPTKLANAVGTEMGIKSNNVTIGRYLDHLSDAFIVSKALRYDVKGRHYFNTPMKYYAADCGLRNAALNFRQTERPHLRLCKE